MTDLLTLSQVSALRGIGVRTLRNWCVSGHLLATMPGNEWLVRRQDAEAVQPPKRGRPRKA